MQLHVRIYVLLIATLAAGVAAAVYVMDPVMNPVYMNASLSFGALGMVALLLAHQGPLAGARQNISFLPFLASVVLAPHWSTLLAVALAVAISQMIADRPPMKTLFNVGQLLLATGASVLVYRALGGTSLLQDPSFVLPALAVALPLFVIVNTIALDGVLALSNRVRFLTVFGDHSPTSIVYDLLALPFVYVFAWFYVQFGPVGAALLAIPLFGVRELHKKNDQLQRTNQELLELMVAAIEARDPYTSGHSRRVAANTRLIAEAIGLKKKQVDRVYTAALLHDVGKIYEVFGPILGKPGRLTPDELAIMKTHSALGADLVSRVTQLADVVEPIRHHHENWDGTGYPDGVAGESIPLSSRIIMFADTVDAMMSDRPYRAALSPLQVRHEISRLSGKQFDPVIAEKLLASPLWVRLFENAPQGAVRAQAQTRVATSIASA